MITPDQFDFQNIEILSAWIWPAIAIGSSLFGNLLGNRKKKTEQENAWNQQQQQDYSQQQQYEGFNEGTQEGLQTGTWDQSGVSTALPTYDPTTLAARDTLLKQFMGRLGPEGRVNMSPYIGAGLRSINQGSNISQMALRNALASRGMSYSPSAALSLGGAESSRIGQQVNFLSQIPLLQRQMEMENLAAAGDFFKSLPVGTTTTSQQSGRSRMESLAKSFAKQWGTQTGTGTSKSTGSGTSTGSVTQPSNMLGGLFGGLGQGIAYGLGQGWFKP